MKSNTNAKWVVNTALEKINKRVQQVPFAWAFMKDIAQWGEVAIYKEGDAMDLSSLAESNYLFPFKSVETLKGNKVFTGVAVAKTADNAWLEGYVQPRLAAYLRKPVAGDNSLFLETMGVTDPIMAKKFAKDGNLIPTTFTDVDVLVVPELKTVDGSAFMVVDGEGNHCAQTIKPQAMVASPDGVAILKGMVVPATVEHVAFHMYLKDTFEFNAFTANPTTIIAGEDTVKRFGSMAEEKIFTMKMVDIFGQCTGIRKDVSVSRQIYQYLPEEVLDIVAPFIDSAKCRVKDGTKIILPGISGKFCGAGPAFFPNLLGSEYNSEIGYVAVPTKEYNRIIKLYGSADYALPLRLPYDGGVSIVKVVPHDMGPVVYMTPGIASVLGGDFDGDDFYVAIIPGLEKIGYKKIMPTFAGHKGKAKYSPNEADKSMLLSYILRDQYMPGVGMENIFEVITSEWAEGSIGIVMNNLSYGEMIELYRKGGAFTGLSPESWSILHEVIHLVKKPPTTSPAAMVATLKATSALMTAYAKGKICTPEADHMNGVKLVIKGERKLKGFAGAFGRGFNSYENSVRVQHTKMLESLGIDITKESMMGVTRVIDVLGVLFQNLWKFNFTQADTTLKRVQAFIALSKCKPAAKMAAWDSVIAPAISGKPTQKMIDKVKTLRTIWMNLSVENVMAYLALAYFGDSITFCIPNDGGMGVYASLYVGEEGKPSLKELLNDMGIPTSIWASFLNGNVNGIDFVNENNEVIAVSELTNSSVNIYNIYDDKFFKNPKTCNYNNDIINLVSKLCDGYMSGPEMAEIVSPIEKLVNNLF